MARLNLIGGAYAARSIIANAQRCINYYPELNRRDSPVPFTMYQRPGRRVLVSDPANLAAGRGVYRASNGAGYCVIGQKVYSIGLGWVLTQLGVLAVARANNVGWIDNGIDIMIVDGSTFGYTIHMADNSFHTINDPTGTFTGGTALATLDTFILWNVPGTKEFGSTLSNSIVFDGLYIASKTAYPDPIQTLYVNRRELLLMGQLKSEIWYDVGAAQFPFAILPGAYIEHGCVAPYSIASYDIETFWLSQDLSGAYVVLKLRGYDVSRVSNHALEWQLLQLAAAGADLSQAIGWTYQLGGHVFYVLQLPSGDQTWVYDASIGDDPTMAWHQEVWQGNDGPHRLRDNCCAFMYGTNVTQDFANGALYAIDPNRYQDENVDGTFSPIVCTRSFPHIIQAWSTQIGQPADLDGKKVQISMVRLDFEAGYAEDPGATVGLRWSWDRGATYGNTVLQDAGAPGSYITQPLWTQLGAQGRDCVIEVSHQINGPAALNGLWLEAAILAN